MRISSPRLRRLDGALAHLPLECEAMLLSELDGYLAAVILCPDPIPPVEWLPAVWGGEGAAPPLADPRDAQWLVDLVMEHHDAIARMLGKGAGRYVPFLEVDPRHDEILWELWIDGFDAAMGLRPESWTRIVESGDPQAAAALADIAMLVAIARDESDLDRPVIDAHTRQAQGLIPPLIDLLHGWRVRHAPAPDPAPTPAAKIGRNDPCPCGSGRKWKKCCTPG